MGLKDNSLETLIVEVTRLREKVKVLSNERDGIFQVVNGNKPTLMVLIERLNSIEERLQALESGRGDEKEAV